MQARLDDIMVALDTLPASQAGGWEAVPCKVLLVGGNSDHEPLVADIPCGQLGFVRPPPQPKRAFRSAVRFRVPMVTAELLAFRRAFEASASTQAGMDALDRLSNAAWQLAEAHTHARTAVGEGASHQEYQRALSARCNELGISPTLVAEMEEHVNALLAEAYDTALRTCTTSTTAERHHLVRTDARRTRQLEQLTWPRWAGVHSRRCQVMRPN